MIFISINIFILAIAFLLNFIELLKCEKIRMEILKSNQRQIELLQNISGKNGTKE